MPAEILTYAEQTLSGSVVYAVRVFAALLILPWDYGANGLYVRAALSLATALILQSAFGAINPGAGEFLFSLFHGLSAGLILWSPFYIADMLGDLTDTLRGQSMASFYDHNLNLPVNISASIFKYATLALIFQNNFSNKFLYLLSINISLEEFFSEPGRQTLNMLSNVFEYILPFALSALLVQMLIIFCSRLSPQQNFFAEGYVLQSILYIAFCFMLISRVVPA